MQTIVTKSFGPRTSRKGNMLPAYVKATTTSGISARVTIHMGQTVEEAHKSACASLMAKVGWDDCRFVGGSLDMSGNSMVWVSMHANSPVVDVRPDP